MENRQANYDLVECADLSRCYHRCGGRAIHKARRLAISPHPFVSSARGEQVLKHEPLMRNALVALFRQVRREEKGSATGDHQHPNSNAVSIKKQKIALIF